MGAGTRSSPFLLAVFFTAGVVLALAAASLRLCLIGFFAVLIRSFFVHTFFSFESAVAFVISLLRPKDFIRIFSAKVYQITCEKAKNKLQYNSRFNLA